MESFANPFIQIMFGLLMVVISLAGISIRIQKGNKLQKKSIEQSLVRADARYSEFGIFRQGDRTVIKCPSCAEFISLEAKICKNCQSNVEKHVADLIKKMKEFDVNKNREAEVRKIELAKARAESSKKFKKNLPKITLIVVVIIGTLFGGFKFIDRRAETNAKKNQENLVVLYQREMELIANSWNQSLNECGFKGLKVTKYYDSRSLYSNDFIEITYAQLEIEKVEGSTAWNASKNKKLICFEGKLREFYIDFNEREGMNDSPSPNATLDFFYRNGVGVLAHKWL
jgi:hypothetical protein